MGWTGKSGAAPRDHYAEVTERIVAALERGIRPWRRPWNAERAGGDSLAPRNGATGRKYRGLNVLLLMLAALAFGTDPRWITYRQAAERGWQVRRGARGTTVYLFRQLPVRGGERHDDGQDTAGDQPATRHVPLLRHFVVFHASQVDGMPPFVPAPEAAASWRTPTAVDIIAANSGIPVRFGGERAFYAPGPDVIQMPPPAAFDSPAAFAGILLHELGHGSGHRTRLNRDLSGRFGSRAYAAEEARVEFAAAMAGAVLGLDTDIAQHADYIGDWLAVLRDDKREVFRAAADAQRIADWLLGLHPDTAALLAEERRGEAEIEPDRDDAPAGRTA